MGGCFSGSYPKSDELKETVAHYKLSNSHVKKLYAVYRIGDRDRTGGIDAAEFHTLFKEVDSPFLQYLFTSTDFDHNGSLSFAEFVQVVSTFCMYDESEMIQFAFDTFDDDHNKYIEEDEFRNLIKILEAQAADFPDAVRGALRKFDTNRDGIIELEEFAEMNLRYPHLLWPAFRLQYRIQESTLGLSKWNKLMRKFKGLNPKYGDRYCCKWKYCICCPRRRIRDQEETKTPEMLEFERYRRELKMQRKRQRRRARMRARRYGLDVDDEKEGGGARKAKKRRGTIKAPRDAWGGSDDRKDA